MGLDMFAYRVHFNSFTSTKEVDFEDEVYSAQDENGNTLCKEIQYWRKHPNLHGWMENLYYKKGGTKDSFNCVTVELTLEDLNCLEGDIKSGTLPETKGFFFGESNDEQRLTDLKFVKKAKEAIFEGDRVFYDSWW
jgi:hypothetical protein